MIAAWMVYALAVSALLAAAGHVLELGLRAWSGSLRWAWVGALFATVALSALPWLRPIAAPPAGAMAVGSAPLPRSATPDAVTEAPAPIGSVVTTPERAVRASLGAAFRRVPDAPLLLLWAALSGGGLLFLAGTYRSLRRKRRLWRGARVDGVPLLVSRDVGPAVVGFLDGSIVLPEWALGLDRTRRRLVVRHEQEHLAAGDSRLLAAGLVALLLMPWNAPLWWQVRRLRHAIELDCDARVLARYRDARAYGALLVEIGQRTSGLAVAFPGFSEAPTFLERRIRAMLRSQAPRRRALGGAAWAVALGLVLLACEVPLPTAPEAKTASAAAVPIPPAAEPDTVMFTFPNGDRWVLRVVPQGDHPPQVCGTGGFDPSATSDEGQRNMEAANPIWELNWPGCNGRILHSDSVVTLPRVRPVVTRMREGSFTWNVGLRPGDVILEINGIDSRRWIAPFKGDYPNRHYRVRVNRAGVTHELEFDLPPEPRWGSQGSG